MVTALSNTNTSTSSKLFQHTILPSFNLHRRTSFLLATPRRLRCLAIVGGPPSPPSPDPPPPPPGNTTQLTGFVGAVTRNQERIKIFLAVLFWMSLFFWVTVTDGRGKGKGKKGSRFK